MGNVGDLRDQSMFSLSRLVDAEGIDWGIEVVLSICSSRIEATSVYLCILCKITTRTQWNGAEFGDTVLLRRLDLHFEIYYFALN